MPDHPDRRRSTRPRQLAPGVLARETALDAACRTAARSLGAPHAVVLVEFDDGGGLLGCHGPDPDGGAGDRGQARAAVWAFLEATDNAPWPSHLGLPLRARDGRVAGALVVGDDRPREWPVEALDVLADLVQLVEGVLHARQGTSELLGHVRQRRTELKTLVHDIRQPLSSASGAAQLLDLEVEGEPRAELVDMVAAGVDRAHRMLDEIIRPGEGAPRLLHLPKVVDRACRSVAPPEGNRLQVTVGADATLLGLGEDVERIVSNLVRNAFVHGGPEVCVEVRAWRGLDGATIEVVDDGRGIAPEDVERIFVLGAQGDAHGPGQGLGLHVVRTLARRTGGDVEVEATPAGGATFRVHLGDLASTDAGTIDLRGD